MARYFILGAGKFGKLALTRLSAHNGTARFLVMDLCPEALRSAQAHLGKPGEFLLGDAIAYLAAHLAPDFPIDWLIPAIPVHVAYAWFRRGPGRDCHLEGFPVPKDLESLAATAFRGPEGELYLSRASHLCPDDCPEPETCPVTGEDREPPLWQLLAARSRPELPLLVVPSRLLTPGVGGYPPRELLRLAREALEISGPFLLATACRCHGVVHGLRRREGKLR